MALDPEYYADVAEVRTRVPGTEEELGDPLIQSGLKAANAAINEAARRGGYTVPFTESPNQPDIIEYIAAEFAAGWVLTRPGFSACTDKVPENGQYMMDEARRLLDLLALGDLDIDDGDILGPGAGPGVISSGIDGEGGRERVKQFPFYGPPRAPIDPRPIVHPQLGPRPLFSGSNGGAYGDGYGGWYGSEVEF